MVMAYTRRPVAIIVMYMGSKYWVAHIKPRVGMDNNHGWFIWILEKLPCKKRKSRIVMCELFLHNWNEQPTDKPLKASADIVLEGRCCRCVVVHTVWAGG